MRAEVARVVPGLKAFVEAERGLAFKEDVAVEVLGDDDFLDALYSDDGTEEDAEEQLDPEPTLKALGLRHQRSVVQDDNDAIRGMVFQVKHLVKVEEEVQDNG